jgi:hypothetical protein
LAAARVRLEARDVPRFDLFGRDEHVLEVARQVLLVVPRERGEERFHAFEGCLHLR